MKDQTKESGRSCGCCWVVLAAFLFAIVWVVGFSSGPNYGTTGDQIRTVSHGRQILIALRQYSESQGGVLPGQPEADFKSANEVFRELFKKGICTDERIFSGMKSVFVVDRDIGSPPDFEKAVMPGECGWMLLKHQTPDSHPRTPILIESALSTYWPPRWDVLPRRAKWFGIKLFGLDNPDRGKGKAWLNRGIVVGRLDGTVEVEIPRPDGTLDWESPKNAGWFKSLTPEQVAKLEYWDVEEKRP